MKEDRVMVVFSLKKDSSVLIILFAILLTGLGVLTFIFFEWLRYRTFLELLL